MKGKITKVIKLNEFISLHSEVDCDGDFNYIKFKEYTRDYKDEPQLSIYPLIFYKGVEVGQITLTLFDDNKADNVGESMYEVMDGYSAQAEELYHVIYNKSYGMIKDSLFDRLCGGVFILLDEITIEKEYRNMGIGSEVVKYFLGLRDYPIVLKPFPIEEYAEKTIKPRLVSFYKRLGFKQILRSGYYSF